jgi:hypothetical protein
MRRRFPAILARKAPELGIDAVWAYHHVITPRLVEAANEQGVELIAWTVDNPARIRELAEMGVHGICSNDPRLFAIADRVPAEPEEASKPSRLERRAAKKAAKEAAKEQKAEETG